MKKISFIVALACLSTSAHATKARMIALGEDAADGSYYIQDDRNMFRNSAFLNDYANKSVLEWGNSSGAAGTNLDTDGAPKAQGGFIKNGGAYNYGAYLGNESNTTQLLRMSAWGSGDTLSHADNVLDVFFGGGSDMKWGANLAYSKNKTETSSTVKNEDHSYGARLGVATDNMDAFANIALGNNAKRTNGSNTFEYDGKLGYHVGGTYRMGAWSPFVSWKNGKWDVKQTGSATAEGTFTELQVGAGHTHNLSSTTRVLTRVNYFKEAVELKYAAGTTEGKISKIPLVVGFEADATSWLTLRGSVGHNLIGNVEAKNLGSVPNATVRAVYAARYTTTEQKRTITNSTAVNAGASLTFGSLVVDGSIGANGTDGATAATKSGVLDLDRLLTRVGMTYSF